jgi:hypothetical protein
MACNIVQGNEVLCRDAIGGVQEVYITEFTNVPQANITATSGVITAMTCTSGKKFFTFQLEKENAQYDNNYIPSVENGTLYYESALTFTMKKMSASMKNSIKMLAQNRLMIIVKDNNGVYYLMGRERGVDATDIKLTSGKAFGDMSGATMTFTGKEPDFDNQVTSSLITALLSPA